MKQTKNYCSVHVENKLSKSLQSQDSLRHSLYGKTNCTLEKV